MSTVFSPPAYFINQPSGRLPENSTHHILQQSRPLAFHQSLPGYQPAPLHNLQHCAARYGVRQLWVKDESQRFGLNAFKGLGASYAIHKLLQKNAAIETFCTATDGNHGRAVAWSAALHGKKAVVYMPEHTVRSRVQAIEALGAAVIVTNEQYDATCAIAATAAAENNWQLVQDTSWEGYETIPAYIMAGYLTQFMELENSLDKPEGPGADVVFLQAGVGSWAAAAVWHYTMRYAQHRPQLVIVEPETSDGILESFKNGRRTAPAGSQQTIMAGLNCGIPSLNAWQIIQSGAHAAMRITDAAAAAAMRMLYRPANDDAPITAGESGAAGVAGFITLMTHPEYAGLKKALHITAESRILCFNTEGATDPENFHRIVNSA
jgi:diaminopropionate ammonia-lyase